MNHPAEVAIHSFLQNVMLGKSRPEELSDQEDAIASNIVEIEE